MEPGSLRSAAVCFLVALVSARSAATEAADGDWDDVVVAMSGRPASLPCVDWSVRGAVAVNWMRRSAGADEWRLLVSANERKEFSGAASKPSTRLADSNFQDTGNFSLILVPNTEDAGLYSCLVNQKERKLKERVILLAILTVSVAPAPPVPQGSTLRLIASVSPAPAAARVTWVSPRGSPLLTERLQRPGGAVAKLPRVLPLDDGSYVCLVQPAGRHASPFYAFNVPVSVDAWKVASFRNVTHGPQTSTACLAHSSLPISCPPVRGDYVLVYWQLPDSRKPKDMSLVFQYDRWRDGGQPAHGQAQLRLAGPPYQPHAGDYSFLLSPGFKDGGLYICEVFLNDNVFSQRTMLSVLKVHVSRSPSALVLWCRYTELSQVRRAGWTFQNQSHRLAHSAPYPGSVTVTLPNTREAAGNYTCTLQLNNGLTVRAVYTVTLPPTDSVGVATPSLPLLPTISALLLLVPLVAAAAGALLWRQGNISRRGIEQSLSHHSAEAENIYENPEDLRQTAPQGSVYMDLKPRGEDDVYKELDRYEQCQI